MNEYFPMGGYGLGAAKAKAPIDPATNVLARAGYGPAAKRLAPASTESQSFFSKLPSWVLPVAIVGGVVLIGGLVWLVKRRKG